MGLQQEWDSAKPSQSEDLNSLWEASAPEAQAATPQRAKPPIPSTGDVALNAVPRGAANFLNTPHAITGLVLRGIASIPGAENIPELRELAERFSGNRIMDLAEKSGIVDPNKNPQTGPQRILDSAIQAGVGSAVVPAGGVLNAVRGAGVGFTSGGAGETAKEVTKAVTGSDTVANAVGTAVGMVGPRAISGSGTPKNTFIGTEAKKDILKEGQAAGYKTEPSLVRDRPVVSKIESVAGKGSLSQQFSIENQKVTNQLAAKAIGLPPGTELSKPVLKNVRDRLAEPYREVEKLRASNTNLPWFPNYHSANLLDDLKDARKKSSKFWDSYYRTGDLKFQESAEQMTAKAKQIEGDIEMIAQASGKPKLVEQLRKNRTTLARTYDIEEALQKGTLEVSAPKLQRMFQDGRPLSGELELIAKYEQAYGRDARVGSRVPPPNVSGTDAAAVPLLTMAGTGSIGAPGIMAGGLPLLRGPARKLVLSDMIQKHLLKEVPATPSKTTIGRSAVVGNTLFQNNQNR